MAEFLRIEFHRARLGTAQVIVKNKNGEKGIRARLEAQGVELRFFRQPAPLSRFKSRSIATLPLATIIFSRVPVLSFRAFSPRLRCEFPELLLEKQKQWEREMTQHFAEHSPNPPI